MVRVQRYAIRRHPPRAGGKRLRARRIFAGEGKPMAELLASVGAKDDTPHFNAYIRNLLFAVELPSAMDPSGNVPMQKNRKSLHAKRIARPQTLIEPLSQRELDVLRLLRSDLNGPEIAREFTLSLATVRSHTQAIYAKLGVNNRRAAVRRAEELDLL